MARPTASAAASGPGPVIFTTRSPTSVARRCPPISARGCAAAVSGEPMISTIEVANGTKIRGKVARVESFLHQGDGDRPAGSARDHHPEAGLERGRLLVRQCEAP